MENQNEIMETVEQVGSKKGFIAKAAVTAIGLAAGVGAAIFFRKKRLEKLVDDEDIIIDNSDNNESTEE